MRQFSIFVLLTAVPLTVGGISTRADDEATNKKYSQIVDKAIAFLATKGQADDGSFNASAGPAVTALVTSGILRQGRSPEDPVVAKALKYLDKFVREDGGIYAEGTVNKNYETCIAIVCFTEANRGGKYNALLKKAEAFVKASQWGPGGEHIEIGRAHV